MHYIPKCINKIVNKTCEASYVIFLKALSVYKFGHQRRNINVNGFDLETRIN